MRAGVVGAGFGLGVHVPGLRAAGFDVAAICAATLGEAAGAARRASIPFATADATELATRNDIDLVCVASPPAFHREHVLAALSRGKHVLCEKPFARDVVEAREMLAAAESAGVVHAIDHEFRFLPDRRALRDLIFSGDLGELRSIDVTDLSPWKLDPDRPSPRWWLRRETAGGLLGASGTHWVDAVRWLTGSEVIAVAASLHTYFRFRLTPEGDRIPADSDDAGTLVMRLASGADVTLRLSAVAPFALRRVMVIGSGGAAHIEGPGLSGTLSVFGSSSRRVVMLADETEPVPGVDDGVPAYVSRAFRDLADAVRRRIEGERGEEFPTFADGVRVQETIDGARASHEAGKLAVVPTRA
jgi:predicted dehydrogenase